jgi:hypothetical protein
LQSKGADPEILNSRGLSCYEGLGIDWDAYGDGQGPDPSAYPEPSVGEVEPIGYTENNVSTDNGNDASYSQSFDQTADQQYGDDQGGYYDENGNWVYYDGSGAGAENYDQNGYYDENGNWIEGYYDEQGNWIQTNAPDSFAEPEILTQVIEEEEEEELEPEPEPDPEPEPEKEEPFLPDIPSARKIEKEVGPALSPIPSTPRPAILPDPEKDTTPVPQVTKQPPVRNIFDTVSTDNVAGLKSIIAYGEKLGNSQIVLAMHWSVMRDCSGIATALRPLINVDGGQAGSVAAAKAITALGGTLSKKHKELLFYDACRSLDRTLIDALIHEVDEASIDKGLVVCAKKGELSLVRLLMRSASPEGILRALIAAADGNQLEPVRALHANIQEYFAQNYNSKESLFETHKDIAQSLHRALKDADEANLPDIASLLMSFTSSGSTVPTRGSGQGQTNQRRRGASALKILDIARSGSVTEMARIAKDSSQQNLVAALHTACLDGTAGPAKLILPHVNEVAKRQAFMAASAKGHDEVMKILVPSLDPESLARMFLAAGANGRTRTLDLMIAGGIKNKITEAERGRSLLSAASSGHVGAVKIILPVVNDQRTRARALVSAAARGKIHVVHALTDHVTKEGLLDPSVIGPLHLPFLQDSTKDHSELMSLLMRYASKKAGYSRGRGGHNSYASKGNAPASPSSGHMSAPNMLRRLAAEQKGESSEISSPGKPKNFTPAPTLHIRMAQSDRVAPSSARLGGSKSSFGQKNNGLSKKRASATARMASQNKRPNRRTGKYNIADFERTGATWDGTAHHGHSRFRWRRGPLLGRGRFGSVYVAMNIENGELLAVKQVPIESQTDKRMLQREISLMRSMSVRSDNVVYCVATELFGDVFSIFMEYIPGGSIKNLMSEFGPLKEGVVRAYTKQMLNGLRILHDSGIAHRDIKADNLLLTDKGTIKLADFGSAKRISTSTMHSTKAAQAIKGSPLWMAPEVIRQEIPMADDDPEGNIRGWKRADVWSVGCTVIEMFTGKPPFEYFSNPTTAMFHIASCKEPPGFPKDMHEDGLDLLGRCFSINSNVRPSIDELSLHTYPEMGEDLDDD